MKVDESLVSLKVVIFIKTRRVCTCRCRTAKSYSFEFGGLNTVVSLVLHGQRSRSSTSP